MTAWQRAKQWWDENVVTETFEETLGWHLSNGIIYSTPQVFLLAHDTHWDGEMCDDSKDPNACFVVLAAAVGHANALREFIRAANSDKQWALWRRRNGEVRAYDLKQLARKVRI